MFPSSVRVASRRLLVDLVMVFLDSLRRGLPRRRGASIEVLPHVVNFLTSGAGDLLYWRINVALHTPITVGRIVGRVITAAKPNGPLHEIVRKALEGELVEREDVLALTEVIESATVDVLNDITDVNSAALNLPVGDAIRITLEPRFLSARKALQKVLLTYLLTGTDLELPIPR